MTTGEQRRKEEHKARKNAARNIDDVQGVEVLAVPNLTDAIMKMPFYSQLFRELKFEGMPREELFPMSDGRKIGVKRSACAFLEDMQPRGFEKGFESADPYEVLLRQEDLFMLVDDYGVSLILDTDRFVVATLHLFLGKHK